MGSKGWLSRKGEVVYDILSSSGKKQKVRIVKSPDANQDLMMRQVVLQALNAMPSENLSPKSKDELRNLISVLEEQRQNAPLSQQVHLALSRAYRNIGEFDRANATLSEYIAGKYCEYC